MVDQQRDHGIITDLQAETDQFEEKTIERLDELETAAAVSNNDHQYLSSVNSTLSTQLSHSANIAQKNVEIDMDLEQLFNITSGTYGKALELEAEFNNLDARTNASESAIFTVQEQLRSVEDSNIQLNGTLQVVEDQVSDLEVQATQHSDQLSTNKDTYDWLKFGFGQISYQAVENKNKIAQQEANISDARGEISDLRTESQDTKQELELANTQFEELKEANNREHKAFEESILNGQTKQESTQAELSKLKENYQNYVDNSTRWKDDFSGFILSDILNINKTLDESADEAKKRDMNIDLLENEIKMFKEEYREDSTAREEGFSTLSDAVVNLTEKVTTNGERYDAEINQAKDDIAANEDDLIKLTALSQRTTDEINSQLSHSANIAQKNVEIDMDLEQLFNITSGTYGKALELEAEFNNLDARTNASESAIFTVQEQLRSVEDSNIQLNGTLQVVEDQVSDLEVQATQHSDQLSTNKDTYDWLKFGFGQISYQAVENKNKIAQQEANISDARGEISDLRTESQDTKQELELANTQFEELKEANNREHKAFEESILNGQTKQESTQAELSKLKENYQNYVDTAGLTVDQVVKLMNWDEDFEKVEVYDGALYLLRNIWATFNEAKVRPC